MRDQVQQGDKGTLQLPLSFNSSCQPSIHLCDLLYSSVQENFFTLIAVCKLKNDKIAEIY